MKKVWLLQRIHVSWLLAWLSLGVVAGIAVSPHFMLAASTSLLILSVSLLLGSLCVSKKCVVPLALIAGVAFGLCRGGSQQIRLTAYTSYVGQPVTVGGRVNDDAAIGPSGDQRVTLDHVALNGRQMPGRVWVSTFSRQLLQRGAVAQFNGTLSKGFGSTPASMFFARCTAVSNSKGDPAVRLRNWFAGAIRRVIPEPQASLGVGFLVGQHSTLPAELDKQLKMVGLTHAIVASGYNLTILVGFARRLLLKYSKYLATACTVGLVGGFAAISGLSPSMSRAALVTSLTLAAWYYGRAIHPFILLAVAAAITTLVQPSYLWGDLGWELSFASFAGVMLLAPLINKYFWEPNAAAGAVRRIFVETISAQVATLPIMAVAFSQYSPYALPANLLVLPFVPLAMMLVFAAGIGGLGPPGLAHFMGLPATWLLHYMTGVVGWIANLPGAEIDFTLPASGVIISYGLLLLCALYFWRQTGHRFRESENIISGGSL